MKAALCIGINNYPGSGNDLNGCVNDAVDWAAVLEEHGFDVVTLLDGSATRDNIISGISELLATADNHGDSAIITYSGHGTWVPDQNGDEIDGRDEALCPHDIGQGRPILDDKLAALFASRSYGVKLTFISDSCHSGTVSRLCGPCVDQTTVPRFMPPERWMKDLPNGRLEMCPPAAGMRMTMTDLLIAGCSDLEYSYDAWFGGRANGAFTRAAIDKLKGLPENATYATWFKAIRKRLPSVQFPQTPQIYGVRGSRYRRVLA